jgi:two-component system nitrate/nitrite response regulator NarL
VQDPADKLLRPQTTVLVLVAVRLYRDGISDALDRDPRFRVVGSADSLEAAREETAADVAVVDVALPEGAGAARALRALWPSTRIVALAVREADEDVVSWAEAGVAGLVTREATLDELLDAVEGAAAGEAVCSPAVTGALLRRVAALAGERRTGDASALTRREREIVRLIDAGLSNKEIAGSLRIELTTVKNHVHNILEKLHVRRRMDAVAVTRARGELDAI